MNLYEVVSEELWAVIPVLDYGQGPREPYCICELVVAETRGQAKWDAWKTDKSFEGTIDEMPKFRTRLVKKFVEGPRRIATDELWAAFEAQREPERRRA